MNEDSLLAALPDGVRSRFVDNNNGCVMHVLEAGFDEPRRPCILLLHGFPELAFSWRRQLAALASAGYHVVAPDQRGFGRSGGTEVKYEDDLMPYSYINRVADALGLVRAMGHEHVEMVVGHDYGSHVAGWCALLRPDVFRSVTMMSAPFPGAPVLPLGSASAPSGPDAMRELGKLARPRKHYWVYYTTPQANDDMWKCKQGVHDFLRAYFHFKSGDWLGNQPFPLQSLCAEELAKLPEYYVMDAAKDMAQTAAERMPSREQIAACDWLPEAEMKVYGEEYSRTGFQGGLQAYRVRYDTRIVSEMRAFSGRTMNVPSQFISGAMDWGSQQVPQGLEKMRGICTKMGEPLMVEGAGHWVQQERPAEVNRLLLEFVAAAAGKAQ